MIRVNPDSGVKRTAPQGEEPEKKVRSGSALAQRDVVVQPTNEQIIDLLISRLRPMRERLYPSE
jgi:hypothetical protein